MTVCQQCGAEFREDALSCPACNALIHADELGKRYSQAKQFLAVGSLADASVELKICLTLLPSETRQAKQIGAELARIEKQIRQRARSRPASSAHTRQNVFAEVQGITGARIGELQAAIRGLLKIGVLPHAAGLVIGRILDAGVWSVAVVWMILSLIVRGLLNAGTWRSLAAWVVLLGLTMGWWEAALFGGYIFLHEIGHLVPVQYYGIGFRWPFFIPFVGAFVVPERLADRPSQNVAISLGGPIGGILPSVFVLLFSAVTGIAMPETVREISVLSLVIGLSNLAPFWILDGARIASLLTRPMLVAAAMVIGVCAWSFGSILGWLLVAAYLVRACMPVLPEDDLSLPERCRLWFQVFLLGATVAVTLPFVP